MHMGLKHDADRALIAWSAGFIDGEGYIGATVIKPKVPTQTVRYQPRLTVGQVNLEPLERLRTLFAGNITTGTVARENRKQFFTWSLTGATGVHAALAQIEPLLTVKREQAVLMLELCARITSRPRGGRTRLSVEEADARAALAARMRALTGGKHSSHCVRAVDVIDFPAIEQQTGVSDEAG